MLLRMSTLLLKTLREEPADAEVPSHRLLLRAGYIRRAAPGGYTWLPLGKLVLDRVTRVVREEMTAVGGQEVSFPALLPREPYDVSGRWTEYGDDIFTLTRPARRRIPARAHARGDVHPAGAGHDQLVPGLSAGAVPGADQVPGRGPAARRAAARARVPDEGRVFVRPHRRRPGRGVRDACARRTSGSSPGSGLDHTIVAAMSGAMGGSASEEFLATVGGGRGHLRRLHALRLRGEHRGGDHAGAGRAARREHGAADRARHPGHPDHRVAGRPGQRSARSTAARTGPPRTR